MASTTSPSRTSASLHPPSASNKRPASMSVVTPYFVLCPIKPISRPSSSYTELKSPPSSPLQKSTFGINSDPRDHKQPQQQQQQLRHHGRRRLNESRLIQIPMDLRHTSSTSRSTGDASAKRFPFGVPSLSVEKKNMYLNTPSADGGAAVARPLSPSKRISSLLLCRQRSSHSSSSISIHPANHCSTPNSMQLGDSDEFEEVPIDSRPPTPTPATTTTAIAQITDQKLESSVEEINVDMEHDGQSSPTSSAQIPMAVGHTTHIQAPRRVPSMTLNSNCSNIDLTNSIRSQSSASSVTSSLHCTSFKTPTPYRHATTAINIGQEQDPSAPKRRKTLLKSMSSSMRMVKKRAADILFGSIRHKRNKKSKTFLPDQDEVDESSLVTKVEDPLDDNEDYDISRLSLSSTVAPSVVSLPGSTASLSRVNPSSSLPESASSPKDVDVISLASCSSKSSDHTAPPLTAAVAADFLQMSSWLASSNGPSLFTRSAEDLTRLRTSNFYDFSGCDPSIIDNGHQTLVVDTEAGPHHRHDLRRRRRSVSAASTAILQESSSASSASFVRHLNLHYGLEDVGTNDEGDKQSQDELQKSTSTRFGGQGYRKWILSKNRLPSFMTKYSRRSGKKDQKETTTHDVNGFVLGCVGGNRSDPCQDRDVGELMELIVVDSPVSSTARKTSKIARKHSISIPLSPSSSSSSSHTSSPYSSSPAYATPFQYAIDRRKKTQQQQHQYKQEREEQQESEPTSKAFRRTSLTPDIFSAPPMAILCQPPPPPPSIVVSSAQGHQQVFVPNP